MKEKLDKVISECYTKLEKALGHSLPRPTISFNLRGKAAGKAHLTENKIRLNRGLLMFYESEVLNQTLPHEIAHLAAWQHFKHSGHGREWAWCMGVLGKPPNVYHTLDVNMVKEVEQTLNIKL